MRLIGRFRPRLGTWVAITEECPGEADMTVTVYRRWLGLLLVGFGLSLTAGLVSADDKPAHVSHVPLPPGSEPVNLKKLFEDRLRKVDAQTQKLNEEELRKLREEVGKFLKNQ